MADGGYYAFMVKKPDGMLAITRGAWISEQHARDAYVNSLESKMTWKQCYRRGARVVVVRIKEQRVRA